MRSEDVAGRLSLDFKLPGKTDNRTTQIIECGASAMSTCDSLSTY